MRKFLCEYDSVWTLDELKNFFDTETDDREYMTFEQWLADCLGKNGALTEILTEDTPNSNGKYAVTLCRVWCADEDDYFEEWLTEEQAHDKFAMGYYVKIV